MTTTSPSNRHVMLDIESLSLHPSNAVILSIGMIEFDPWARSFSIGATCIITPNVMDQIMLGRIIDPDTVDFWRKQPAAAAEHWRNSKLGLAGLEQTCEGVAVFLSNAQCVWANGILFDLGNIDGLFRQVRKVGAPWHYRAPRDARTFWEETPQTRNVDVVEPDELAGFPNLVDHEPISDCIKQAHRVWQHWPNGKAR